MLSSEYATGKGLTMQQTRKRTIITGCALLLFLLGGCCWGIWDTQLARHPNQLFGQLHQHQAPTSMCWGVSTDGSTVRLSVAAPPPFVYRAETFSTYRAHKYLVTAISCALDTIASVDEGGTLRVWGRQQDASTVMTIRCHVQSACALRAVAWKPGVQTYIQESAPDALLSEKYIAFGGDSGLVQMVSVPDGKVVARYMLPPLTRVTCLQWSFDGKYLAAGGYTGDDGKGLIRVWDGQTGQEVSTYWGHAQAVDALAWSPDNQQIASASNDTTVQIWRATTGKQVFTYHGHTRRVNTLSWTATNNAQSLIASGSDDRTVQVWNAQTGQLSFTHFHAQAVTAVIWDSGSWIASGSRDGVIDYYWGVENPLYLPGL